MAERFGWDAPDEPNDPDAYRKRGPWVPRVEYGDADPDEASDELDTDPDSTDEAEDLKPEEPKPEEPERRWLTIFEETGQLRSYRSFTAAKRHLVALSGTEIHHLVEQSQAKRSGFTVERVNTTDNLARIPVETHREVSRWYSSRPPGYDKIVRDTLNGKSWDYQHQYGAEILDMITGADDDDD